MVSEYYAKTQEGMWVKARLIDEGIELLWQVRTRVNCGNFILYDANGNIESSQSVGKIHYPDFMKSAGIVKIDDDFIEFCGIKFFNDMVASVMRHMVAMVIVGYGDSPEDIVEWYSDISGLKFLTGTRFKFDYECDPFIDMVGLIGFVDINDDGEYFVNVNVNNDYFCIPLDCNDVLVSFIISTTPV